MILVFRYYPAVESDRHIPTGAPERLIHYASFLNRDLYTPPNEEGEFVVLDLDVTKVLTPGKVQVEVTDVLRVAAPEPAKAKVSKLKSLGN